jgi:hypothetical protein
VSQDRKAGNIDPVETAVFAFRAITDYEVAIMRARKYCEAQVNALTEEQKEVYTGKAAEILRQKRRSTYESFGFTT